MFMIAAAPPNSAAAPTAPVFMGMAMPSELELAPESGPPPVAAAEAKLVGAAVLIEVVAWGTPLVNGVPSAEVASLKAGA